MFHEEHMGSGKARWKGMSRGKKALVIAGWTGLVAAALAAVGLLVSLLWNRIMSGILGLPALGFFDAIGLFILFRIFLGGRGSSFISRMRMRRAMRSHAAKRAEAGEGNRD